MAMDMYYNENPQTKLWREKYEALQKEYQLAVKENQVLVMPCKELQEKLGKEEKRADANFFELRDLKKRFNSLPWWKKINCHLS